MNIEDYEQELALHLLRRRDYYNEERSSFPTYADRITRNRSRSLAKKTKAQVVERQMLSLDDTVENRNEDDIAIQDLVSDDQSLWPDSRLSCSERINLRIDLGRFIRDLPPSLRRCLGWLLADGVKTAIRDGVHRSSFYDALERLRVRAAGYDLKEYLRD